jgi:hypothetical protein
MGQYNTPNTPDPGGINGFAARAAGRIYVGVGECPRLHLHALAYILGSFMRMLAVLKAAEPWSPTSLREKLIKIGARSSATAATSPYSWPTSRCRGRCSRIS